MAIDQSSGPKKMGRLKYFFRGIGRFVKGHLLLCIVLVVLLGVGIFFGRKALAMKKMASMIEDVGILTTEVEKMDLQKSVSVTGSLAAGQSKSVTSTVATGTKVAAVNYEVGDYVEEGSVVVEFDADDYNTKLAELNAKYNINDKKNAKALKDYLKKIEDDQKEIQEIQEWLEDNKIYYEDVKDAYDNYKKYPYAEDAKKRYEEQNDAIKTLHGFTLEEYESKQDKIEELQDDIEENQYNYELAQLQQSYDNTYTKGEEYDKVTDSQSGTQVVAPISGYITAINVTAGNNYTQGNTVFTISNTDSFVVDASVDEYDIASLKEGLEAVVKFDATDDDEFTGKVTYVAVTSDSTTSSSSGSNGNGMSSSSSSSSSYEVKITLDSADERLRVGMTAKASVILESAKDCFAVPYDCVETDKDGSSYVTQVGDNDEETRIPVTLGLESDYYVQIISDKLSEGMKVKATASSGKSSSDSLPGGDFPGGDFGGGPGGDFGGGAPGGGFGGGPGGGF